MMAKGMFDIVYVDDEGAMTQFFETLSRGLFPKKKIKTYCNVPEFVRELEAGLITSKCWLIDVMLPGELNGFEVASRIQLAQTDADIYFYTALNASALNSVQGISEVDSDSVFHKTQNDPADILASLFGS